MILTDFENIGIHPKRETEQGCEVKGQRRIIDVWQFYWQWNLTLFDWSLHKKTSKLDRY